MINKLTPKFHPPKLMAALLFTLMIALMLLGLFSCSKSIPLRHYNKIAADPIPLDNPKKTNILAQKFAALFPIQESTIIHDSIVINKVVKVQDNALVNRLKAQLAKGCPTLDLDSFLFENMITDTIYIDRYKVKEIIKKDTINNYFKALDNEQIKAENVGLKILQKNTSDKLIEATHNSNKWRYRFFVLVGLIIVFFTLKILTKYYTLPIKI